MLLFLVFHPCLSAHENTLSLLRSYLSRFIDWQQCKEMDFLVSPWHLVG